MGLRCVQAAGAAALVPTSLGLILTTLPAERRAHAVRVWAVVGSLGAVTGPALGGVLVALSWRWMFLINIPVGVLVIGLSAVLVPDVRHNAEARIPDVVGGVLLIVAVGALALGLVHGPAWGWGSASTLAGFATAVVAGAAFVLRSSRAPAPVIDLRLFGDRVFARANAAMFFANVTFGLQLLGLILLMQDGWGWSALQTGLAVGPGPAMVSVGAFGIRPRLARLPEGVVAALGILLMGGGGILIGASIGPHASYAAAVLPGWMILGTGVGLSMPSITSAATATLAAQQTSTGSAALQTSRWIGSTIGVSLLVVVLGTVASDGASFDRFGRAWWWAGLPALAGAVMALGITPRAGPAPVSSAAR